MTDAAPNVPAKVVPTSVPSERRDGEVYVFKKQELDFLREYSASLDETIAFTNAQVDIRRRSEMLENIHVKKEMARIQRAWSCRSRMTQEYAGGEHMRLMEKFEENYDSLETGNKPKMAGVLAKMSEATLKATGLIGSDKEQTMPTVIVQMNMGGAPETVAVTVNQGEQENVRES